jgi:hypothetical protein
MGSFDPGSTKVRRRQEMMFPRFLSLLVFAVTLAAILPVGDAEAQIFRRRVQFRPSVQNVAPPVCANGDCLPCDPTLAPPVESVSVLEEANTGWYAKLTAPRGRKITAAEEQAIRSWGNRAVRIINGNSCGTGSLCGRDSQFIYIMTNAHVAGTRIGHVVRCEALLKDGSRTEKFSATVVEAAYSSKTSTDWALLKADVSAMAGLEPIKLSITAPDTDSLTGTWGCPRCEIPSGQLVETSSTSSVWMWQPNSIGGQSGSAVVQGGVQKGLLTWTINGFGAGQFTSSIYKQSRERNVDGSPRPEGLIPVPYMLSPDVELTEGYHSETGIGEYPIWDSGNGSENPPPPPSTNPCPEDPEEKRLLDKLRDLRKKNQSLDWVALINLIMQIIDLIGKSKGG